MIGETKLGYKITELIGQGGFGTVYKAVKKNKAMETVRALKHISLPSKKQWTDIYNSMGNDVARTDAYFDTILQEILNEIRILADLTNKGVKNVVWYYENEIEDTPSPKHYDIYLLMEFLTSLPAYIESHEIKVKDVVKIGLDILTALIECHKNKIIHRDIKTDNIFVAEDGAFKLGDFGVSKKLSDKSRATSMKGTPNYIAPEVYLGQPYDETVDIYSLGIVLYRLLNYNRNPFMPDYPNSYNSEDEDKAFELRMKGDIPNYPAFANKELGEVIIKSISSKENRYKSAQEFKQALEMVNMNLDNEELEKVVLENMLGNVDFSTFGSKNEQTQMASDDKPSISSESFSNNKHKSQTNPLLNSSKDLIGVNKKKLFVPAIIAVALLLGIGTFFILNNRTVNDGKFMQVNGYDKFKKKNGDWAKDEWVKYSNNEYYFDKKENLVKDDAVDYGGKTYYVDEYGAKIINNWRKGNDGKEYYLDSNGEPFKDTAKTINGEVYFFNKNGEKVNNGWFLYENDYYYIDSNGKMLKDAFMDSSAIERYYLGSDGKMLKNTFYNIGSGTYYFDVDGKMKINTSFQAAGGLYYAQSDGTIKKNGWSSNNQYYAGSDGKLLVNTTTPDGVKVDGTGKRVVANTQPVQSSQPSQPSQPSQSSRNTGSSGGSSIHLAATDKTGDNGSVIYSGRVDWGDHLRYNENVDLEDYGETGNARITINITRVRDDGSGEVNEINRVIDDLFDDACDRAMNDLPYESFELTDTSLATCNVNSVVINYKGEIAENGGSKTKIQYKVTLDRKNGSANYVKVK